MGGLNCGFGFWMVCLCEVVFGIVDLGLGLWWVLVLSWDFVGLCGVGIIYVLGGGFVLVWVGCWFGVGFWV